MQYILVGIILMVITGVLGLFIGLIPALTPDNQFVSALDTGIALLIQFFDMARWFIPLNIFVLCFAVMFAVDHFALLSRVVQYLVSLVRG